MRRQRLLPGQRRHARPDGGVPGADVRAAVAAPQLARRLLAVALAAAAGLGWTALADTVAPPPALPQIAEPLPIAESVKDPLFSVLLGLLGAERYGVLPGERLDRAVRARGGSRRFLYGKIAWLSRQPAGAGAAEVQVQFVSPLQLPLPYSILGYHPGSVRSSGACRLREWDLGEQPLGARKLRFQDVRLFAVEEGTVEADVDGWIDALAGPALDDTRLTGLGLLRYGAQRYGVAFGVNEKGQGRAGVLDFRRDRVLMPPPPELAGVATDLVRRSRALRGSLGPRQGATLLEVLPARPLVGDAHARPAHDPDRHVVPPGHAVAALVHLDQRHLREQPL
jgi:hypothetical protein